MANFGLLDTKARVEIPEDVSMADMFFAMLSTAFENLDDVIPLPKDSQGFDTTYEYCTANFKETYTDDIKSLMDSVDNNPVTIAISGNGTGKTHAGARIGLSFLMRFPGSQVYTAAAPPQDNLKFLLWGEIGELIQKNLEMLHGFNISLAGMRIVRKDNAKSFMRGVTIPDSSNEKENEARFSGKHAPYILFILDEGDAIPWAVYRGIESCLSGGFARLLILFNPRQQAGPVYQMQKDNAANIVTLTPFNHPNVITGEDIFPGAVDRNVTCRRINRWTAPMRRGEEPDSECFTVPMFLDGFVATDFNGKPMEPIIGGQIRRVTESSFFYMVLARYPSIAADQLISRLHVEKAQARWIALVAEHGEHFLKVRNRPRCGLDVAEMGVDKNVFSSIHGSWLAPQEEWGGVDVLITGERAANYCKQLNARWCNVDSTGVGAGVAPMMKRSGFTKAHRIMFASSAPEDALSDEQKELGKFGNLRDHAWWAIREWLKNDPNAAIPPDHLLEEELLVATYQIKSGVIKVLDSDSIREKIRRSADHATSLGLAIMGEVVDDDHGPGEFGSSNYVKDKNRVGVVSMGGKMPPTGMQQRRRIG